MRLISVHMFWFGVALTTDGRGSQSLLWDAACLLHTQTSFWEKKKFAEDVSILKSILIQTAIDINVWDEYVVLKVP